MLVNISMYLYVLYIWYVLYALTGAYFKGSVITYILGTGIYSAYFMT